MITNMKRARNWSILCALALISGTVQADDPIPTPVWVDFYGGATGTVLFNGQTAPVGSIVEAFDIDNVLCGRFFAHTSGQYGFMPVYGDEARTVVDEGAEFSEEITFTLNGRPTTLAGPDDNIFNAIAQATQKEVNFSATGTLGLAPGTIPADQLARPGDTVNFTLGFTNTGNVTDFYQLTVFSSRGWTVIFPEDFIYVESGLAEQLVDFQAIVPLSATPGMVDSVFYLLESGLDHTLSLSGGAAITVDVTTGVNDDEAILPESFTLRQNYPNPFNPSTKIPFALSIRSELSLVIYNALGRKIDQIYLGSLSAGEHTVEYNAESLASGIYFYRLKGSNGEIFFSPARSMILLK